MDNMENIPLSDDDTFISNSTLTFHQKSEQCDTVGYNGPTPDLIATTTGYWNNQSQQNGNFHDSFISEDSNDGDTEEKQKLIAQVLELQHTLEDLSSRVDAVKEENLKLRSENQILGQYIENLMAASSVFQSASPKQKRRTQNAYARSGFTKSGD